ncbi:hypothetical protein U1703_15685 [Sphingomonas sp. PB1R3]
MKSKVQPIRRSTKRSRFEWTIRCVLAIAAVALGGLSTTQTIAFALRKVNAERAYALAPYDGRVAGELAQHIAAGDVSTEQRARATAIAQQALVDEPLAIPALTALGINTQLRGDTVEARELFAHSDALSRRELGTRLWLIEDAVGRGDTAGALRNYDIALRTEKGASELLFPILAQAISDSRLASALADTMAARPAWSEPFIGYLAAVSTTPDISAPFLQQLAKRGVPISEAARISMVNALVNIGKMDAGWSYYASFHKGAARDRSRDPNFAFSRETPAAFDWVPVTSEAGINASIQSTSTGGVFDFAVSSSVGGTVLQQTQLLPPGRYRLEGISAGIQQAPSTRPYWQLTCSDGHEAGRVELPNSTENGGRFTGEVTVGAGCPTQVLRLVVRPSLEVGGVGGQIERAALVPVAAGR